MYNINVLSMYVRSYAPSLGFNSTIFCMSSCDSGTHKQKDQEKRSRPSGQAAPNTLDHAFVTPRVKSAAKSRQAVSLLNKIVSEKDRLLKGAIESMERKEKILLTSKNNDFLKFVSGPPASFNSPDHTWHKESKQLRRRLESHGPPLL